MAWDNLCFRQAHFDEVGSCWIKVSGRFRDHWIRSTYPILRAAAQGISPWHGFIITVPPICPKRPDTPMNCWQSLSTIPPLNPMKYHYQPIEAPSKDSNPLNYLNHHQFPRLNPPFHHHPLVRPMVLRCSRGRFQVQFAFAFPVRIAPQGADPLRRQVLAARHLWSEAAAPLVSSHKTWWWPGDGWWNWGLPHEIWAGAIFWVCFFNPETLHVCLPCRLGYLFAGVTRWFFLPGPL